MRGVIAHSKEAPTQRICNYAWMNSQLHSETKHSGLLLIDKIQ